MAYAQFITIDYLKKHTIIDNNVDSNLLDSCIRKATEINIQETLGTDLYNKLVTDIIANTLTGNYQTLMNEYVQRCLAEWTLFHALPFINYRVNNVSVVKKNSENSTNTDLDELKYLRAITADNAEFYSERITKYLQHNSTLFPEYSTNTNCDITPNKTNYNSGIY